MVDELAMPAYFGPLPTVPDFPVYGLDGSFVGPRGMWLWDSSAQMPLWRVELGHGPSHALAAPSLVSITIETRPARPGVRSGPTGLVDIDDAVGKALLYLFHAVRGSPWPDPSAAVESLTELAGSLGGPPWNDATGIVDGRPVNFQRYRHAESWVAAADLGPVAVALYGTGIELEDHGLEPVNGILDRYRTHPPAETLPS